jgi:hypothetical protein
MAAFRFQFDNPSPSAWDTWHTCYGGPYADDPYALINDQAENHSGQPNGYGCLVHVPVVATPVKLLDWGRIKSTYR